MKKPNSPKRLSPVRSTDLLGSKTCRAFIVVPFVKLNAFATPQEARREADKRGGGEAGPTHTVVEVVAQWDSIYSSEGLTKGEGFRRLPVGAAFHLEPNDRTEP